MILNRCHWNSISRCELMSQNLNSLSDQIHSIQLCLISFHPRSKGVHSILAKRIDLINIDIFFHNNYSYYYELCSSSQLFFVFIIAVSTDKVITRQQAFTYESVVPSHQPFFLRDILFSNVLSSLSIIIQTIGISINIIDSVCLFMRHNSIDVFQNLSTITHQHSVFIIIIIIIIIIIFIRR